MTHAEIIAAIESMPHEARATLFLEALGLDVEQVVAAVQLAAEAHVLMHGLARGQCKNCALRNLAGGFTGCPDVFRRMGPDDSCSRWELAL